MLRPGAGAVDDWDARRSRSAYVVLPVVDDQADMMAKNACRYYALLLPPSPAHRTASV